jgi:hypothetical protein
LPTSLSPEAAFDGAGKFGGGKVEEAEEAVHGEGLTPVKHLGGEAEPDGTSFVEITERCACLR